MQLINVRGSTDISEGNEEDQEEEEDAGVISREKVEKRQEEEQKQERSKEAPKLGEEVKRDNYEVKRKMVV